MKYNAWTVNSQILKYQMERYVFKHSNSIESLENNLSGSKLYSSWIVQGDPQRKLTRRNWSWDSTDENNEGIFVSDYIATNSYDYEKSETATFSSC